MLFTSLCHYVDGLFHLSSLTGINLFICWSFVGVFGFYEQECCDKAKSINIHLMDYDSKDISCRDNIMYMRV